MIDVNWESRALSSLSSAKSGRLSAEKEKGESLELYLKRKRKEAYWVFAGRSVCLTEGTDEILNLNGLVNLG